MTEPKRAPITGMTRYPVRSSNIAEVGHDELSGVVEIKFKNGAVWQYPGPFDKHTFDALRNADSVGKFFRAHIWSRNHAQRHVCVTQDEDQDPRVRKQEAK